MTNEDVIKAKQSLNSVIKFIELLISRLSDPDETVSARALLTGFCIDRYFDEFLIQDIQKLLLKYGKPDEQTTKDLV
jgi:hypothetical protein